MPINIDPNRLNELLRPIFQQMGQNPQVQPDTNMLGGDDEALNQAMMSLLTPKDEQYDRFAQMLKMIPQRENFQPGKVRKVGAFLAGLGAGSPLGISGGQPIGYKSDVPGGLKIKNAILDEPYDRALSDWSNSATPTLEAAKLENTRNVNSRIAGTSLKTADLKAKSEQRMLDRNAQLAREGDQRIEASQAKIEIDKKKQAAVDFKNSHPDYKTVTREDGEVMFYNPKDPSAKPIDSGLKGTDLSDMEKIQLQHEGRMEEIQARGEQQRTTNAEKPDSEKGWSVQDNYDPDTGKWIGKVRVNSITGESVPIKGAKLGPRTPPKEGSEADKAKGMINKANQIISSNPKLKGYIVFEKNNAGNIVGVHILPRGLMGMAPNFMYDQEKANEAYNMLFGESKPESNTESGKVIVEKDGKKYNLPASQLEDAIKQGYKKVG